MKNPQKYFSELINEFSNISGYKSNTQKQFRDCTLAMNNLKRKLKNNFIYNRNKLDQGGKRRVWTLETT